MGTNDDHKDDKKTWGVCSPFERGRLVRRRGDWIDLSFERGEPMP